VKAEKSRCRKTPKALMWTPEKMRKLLLSLIVPGKLPLADARARGQSDHE
jgi:hypothetical protein